MICSFCNNSVQAGTGMIFVRRDGSVLNFCSRKCRANQLVLRREGRLQKWTSKAVVVRGEKKQEEKKESVLAKEIEEKLAEKAKGQEKKK